MSSTAVWGRFASVERAPGYPASLSVLTRYVASSNFLEALARCRIGHPVRVARVVVANRITVAYTLAMSSLYAVFISYLGTAENIFSQTFDQHANFPYIFGGLAAVMGLAMLVNARC